MILISAGSTTGTVNFTPTDDSVYEGDETATIDVSGVSGGSNRKWITVCNYNYNR